MTHAGTRRLAWGAFVVVVLSYALGFSVEVATEAVDVFDILSLAFPVVGIFILARDPQNRIGWILMSIGLMVGAGSLLDAYVRYGLAVRPGSLPAPAIAAALAQGLWAPVIGVIGIHLILLFPDGRLPSRRWRTVAWVGGIAITATWAFFAVLPEPIDYESLPKMPNPIGIEALRPLLPLLFVFIALIPISIVASAVSLVRRFRRAEGTVRLQLKWLTAAAATIAALYALSFLSAAWPHEGPGDSTVSLVAQEVAVFSFVLIPIAIGFAVLKYRLYDIDVVINKTLVYGALAAFITLIYVGIVVGVGALIGQGDRPNLGLSILATAVVAVAFQPVRERVQRFANRLVYGKRATPYEVLSHFAERMASTYAADELLPQMARVLAEGTAAAGSEVWLKVGAELRPAGSWPDSRAHSVAPLHLSDGGVPMVPGRDLSVEVRDRGELLGALSITKHRGEQATDADRKLLSDLASQAGLVLRNVRLIEELRASRQRIVSAQDEERRRIERNIHDGAQQQLVALNVKLGLARTLLSRDADKSQQMIEQLQAETQDALENLRDLARGIYPPLLRDQGLVAALEAQARKVQFPVDLDAQGIGRYEEDIEATIYFCVLEALQNIVKYAQANRAVVTIRRDESDLVFEVSDDGRGFDPRIVTYGTGLQGMADRLEAAGGAFTVNSEMGQGTTVSGRVPADSVAAETLRSDLEPVG